ncbi:hypothetical protein CONCODRAFT_3286 [Conidiobolus coronatus NRRL 28638]|uniref:G-protein coupled receptors family 1 profile domain-containing protein n=1 Tax=Conidiobolus coronatus (strain ATCC 28846 / CBS 209.66 / NRRL 28638) TaxID=796925 RepID=A0A137PFE5_CONC2|nr:hypothetical protein CONCODRAFT_3286 [Conidiobolus coronatus NRRL 28638]|eukprot:KXN73726.1 hypothetical protein CONCODRAFT_3286 [Conidiobolus coronatus NRRL 28638]
MNLTAKIGIVLHPIGIVCSVLVLSSIIGFAIIDRKLANRMTVRLIAAIALADLISHTAELYAAWYRSIDLHTSLCHKVNGVRLLGRTFYAFTNLAICFHLYRSIVQLKKPTMKFEIITYIVTVAMTGIFVLIYWALGAYSGVLNKNGCNPGADDFTLNVVFYIIAGLVDFSAIVGGIFITVAGHRNLNKWINVYSATLTQGTKNQEQLIKDRRKMALRSFLYPLSTCITLPFECIFHFFAAANMLVLTLGVIMTFTIAISGLLTGIAFTIDPATHIAFKSAYYQLKHGKSDKKVSEEFNME